MLQEKVLPVLMMNENIMNIWTKSCVIQQSFQQIIHFKEEYYQISMFLSVEFTA